MNKQMIGHLSIVQLLAALMNNEDSLPKVKLIEVEPTSDFFFEQSGIDINFTSILKTLIEEDDAGDFAIRIGRHTTSGSTKFTKSELSEPQLLRGLIGKTEDGKAYLRMTVSSGSPSVIIFVLNNCEDNAVVQVTASGLPDGGDSFNLQGWNGSEWIDVTPVPLTVENGYSEIPLENIVYEATELRMINLSETITSNEYTIVPCPLSLLLEVTHDCALQQFTSTATAAGLPEPTTFHHQYSDDNGATWQQFNSDIELEDGEDTFDVLTQDLANGTYLFRLISLDESIESNHWELTLNCASPSVEVTGADYDCNTDNLVVDFTLTSIHAAENITFRVGIPSAYFWTENNVVPGSTFTFSTVVPALANGTYEITAEITDANGTHTSEPFELIVSCP